MTFRRTPIFALAALSLVPASAARGDGTSQQFFTVEIRGGRTVHDDLPRPPKVASVPKSPQPALNGYANLTLNGTALGPQTRPIDSHGRYRVVMPFDLASAARRGLKSR
jgi:hypothetical protein